MKNKFIKPILNKLKKNIQKKNIIRRYIGTEQTNNIETQTATQNIGDYFFVKWFTDHWEYVDSSGNQLTGKTWIYAGVLFEHFSPIVSLLVYDNKSGLPMTSKHIGSQHVDSNKLITSISVFTPLNLHTGLTNLKTSYTGYYKITVSQVSVNSSVPNVFYNVIEATGGDGNQDQSDNIVSKTVDLSYGNFLMNNDEGYVDTNGILIEGGSAQIIVDNGNVFLGLDDKKISIAHPNSRYYTGEDGIYGITENTGFTRTKIVSDSIDTNTNNPFDLYEIRDLGGQKDIAVSVNYDETIEQQDLKAGTFMKIKLDSEYKKYGANINLKLTLSGSTTFNDRYDMIKSENYVIKNANNKNSLSDTQKNQIQVAYDDALSEARNFRDNFNYNNMYGVINDFKQSSDLTYIRHDYNIIYNTKSEDNGEIGWSNISKFANQYYKVAVGAVGSTRTHNFGSADGIKIYDKLAISFKF